MPTAPAPHSDETKAAVLAALLAGQSVTAVAAEYKVARETVRKWRRAAGMDAGSVVSQQKKADIGDLVASYLRELLQTLAVQQRHFRDKAWLGQQSAADLAVLHGVSADKAFRILEAIRPDDGPESPTGGAGDAG
jgi:transposase-like protein